MGMRERRRRDRQAEESLSYQDRKSLRRAKLSFFLTIIIGTFLIVLTIGIAVPVTQSETHLKQVENTLKNAARAAENYRGDDLEISDEDGFNLNSYFACRVDNMDISDGSLQESDLIWELGNEEIYSLLLEDSGALRSVLNSANEESVTVGNYQFYCQASDDHTIIVAADNSEFISAFTAGTITLEVLLVIGFLLISGISVSLTGIVFRPVVESMSAQRKFVGDASHELKTPLAVIKADTDLLLNGKDASDPELNWIRSIQEESDRMSETIQDLVTISSLESSFHLQKVEDMSRLINDVALSFDAICFEKGIYYTVRRVDPGVRVNCSSEDTRKLLEELFGNAVKYAEGNPPTIDVSFELGKMSAVFTISNSGCTIKEEDKERVFDRFYRTAEMRASGRAGSGLGLSICKSICEKNKFKISCTSNLGRSTTFTVEMPLS